MLSSLIDRCKDYIFQNHLFTVQDKLLVAVSGGVDSVVLIHVLHTLGYRFAIAHCNFKLRGEESEQDQIFVQKIAEKLEVEFYSKCFDTAWLAHEQKASIQMVARELRYSWFNSLVKENSFSYILTAHHQNDLLETVLLNLVRGTGLAGFHGILPKNGILIRPLLFATREQIVGFAHSHKLNWREDSSNEANKYARNLVRNKVIPLLKELNPNLESTIKETAEKVLALELFANSELEKAKKQVYSYFDGCHRISIELILATDHPLIVLYSLTSMFGFSFKTTKQILQSCKSQTGTIFSSATHKLLKDKDFWLVKEALAKESVWFELTSEQKEFQFKKMKYVLESKEGGIDLVQKLNKQGLIILDYNKLKFPVIVRTWKEGDKFIPIGMSGVKKISDFLIDIKLSRYEKENVLVLESDKLIAAIIGYRPSQLFAVTSETKKVFIISEL